MTPEKDLDSLDNIIDTLYQRDLSGQEMVKFFRLAIIDRTLELCKGDKNKTMTQLQINRGTLNNWLGDYK